MPKLVDWSRAGADRSPFNLRFNQLSLWMVQLASRSISLSSGCLAAVTVDNCSAMASSKASFSAAIWLTAAESSLPRLRT